MAKKKKTKAKSKTSTKKAMVKSASTAPSDTTDLIDGYDQFFGGVNELLEESRRLAARSVNAIMTATYWDLGRHIVEKEQGGEERAEYGAKLLQRLSQDLTTRFGKGFSYRNLRQMRQFYLVYPPEKIWQTLSAKSIELSDLKDLGCKDRLLLLVNVFALSWSHYVELLSVQDEQERQFYEEEALIGGWGIRQLKRQKNSQYYKRTLLSKKKAAMLQKGRIAKPEDHMTPEEVIKDPHVLEFLGLKDEYSESDLEEALILHLEKFLLELGPYFTFVARQKALRVGDVWYRVDLMLFHRKLRCIVLIDLKIGSLTHADAGQMHLYCNYAKEHWTLPDENPPVGLILCSQKDEAVAHYALDGLPNTVLASRYQMELPDEQLLIDEINRTKRLLEAHRPDEESSPELEDQVTDTEY